MSLFQSVSELARHLHGQIERHFATGTPGPQQKALMLELMRPQLGPLPPTLRRLFEPCVAVCAVLALVSLLAVGFASFTVFIFAGALMVVILTQVFGIELQLKNPSF